jgi:hypothetical protein
LSKIDRSPFVVFGSINSVLNLILVYLFWLSDGVSANFFSGLMAIMPKIAIEAIVYLAIVLWLSDALFA